MHTQKRYVQTIILRRKTNRKEMHMFMLCYQTINLEEKKDRTRRDFPQSEHKYMTLNTFKWQHYYQSKDMYLLI